MNTHMLQTFLHNFIPATAALGVCVAAADAEQVILTLPHAPNRNHKDTAFGGSIALGATTCGWALVHLHFPEAQGNIVIQHGSTRYLRPARGELTIRTRPVEARAWQAMETLFRKRGKGKVTVEADVFANGELAAVFTGSFVALTD